MRIDQREPGQLRPVKVTTDYLMTAEGSVLIEVENTRVLCAASVEESVPSFLRGSGKGWVTAEYSMLPRATSTRTAREVSKGRASGRTMEIQRLIGRSLRSVIDMDMLGERSIILDNRTQRSSDQALNLHGASRCPALGNFTGSAG